MARAGVRLRRRSERAHAELRPPCRRKRSLRQRHLRTSGLFAHACFAADRPASVDPRSFPQRRTAQHQCRHARENAQRCRVSDWYDRQVAHRRTRSVKFHPARAPAGLRLLESSRMHSQLHQLLLLCRRSDQAHVDRLRRRRPDPRRVRLHPRPVARKPAVCARPRVGTAARSLLHRAREIPRSL